MRTYGAVPTQFWMDPNRKLLTTDAKLLYVYLISGPHATSLGCYRLSLNYIADDLDWSVIRVKKAILNCQQFELIDYDFNEWVFIKNFLKTEKVENPNQWRGVKRLFEQVPTNLCFYDQLIKQLLMNVTFISEAERIDLSNRSETLSEPFRNQEQEQNQEQDQDQKHKQNNMSGQNENKTVLQTPSTHGVYLNPTNSRLSLAQNQALRKTAVRLLMFLNEKAHRVFRPVETNLKLIMARLISGATEVQCRQVIAKKTREWSNDPKMSVYLRPATLFNATKFEQYVGELVLPRGKENEAPVVSDHE